MIEFLMETWPVVIGIAAVLVAAVIGVMKFAELPTEEQISKIKVLLIKWVIDAERDLGSGTGQLKLRTVYDIFVKQFPVIARVIKFKTFSNWVDDALDEMKKMLKNEKIAAYVGVENEETKEIGTETE